MNVTIYFCPINSLNSVWPFYTTSNYCSTTADTRDGRSFSLCRMRYSSTSCSRTFTITLTARRKTMTRHRTRIRPERTASRRKSVTARYWTEKGKATNREWKKGDDAIARKCGTTTINPLLFESHLHGLYSVHLANMSNCGRFMKLFDMRKIVKWKWKED